MDKNKSKPVYCICRTSVENVFMIMCDYCKEWFHGDCIRMKYQDSLKIDKYCCSKCHKRDKAMKTTYIKTHRNKSKTKKTKVLKRNPAKNKRKKTDEHKLDGVSSSTKTFGFVDTTVRKAKTEANKKLKLDCAFEAHNVRRKTKKMDLLQCLGPGCTNPSRKSSKYCSDDCGVALATNRIVEILPQRIIDYTSTPSAADESSRQKLSKCRLEMQNIRNEVADIDARIAGLVEEIIQDKAPGNDFQEIKSDDPTPMECLLCGAEVQARAIERHLEQCCRKMDRKTIVTQYTTRPDDTPWNVFCNHRISKNVFCKKLMVLCPFHYKDHRKDGEVCGHPLQAAGHIVHCGNVGKTCQHVNWEEIRRAELDLIKLNKLVKYKLLQKEEQRIRREMASRGDMLSLMLNQTIAH